jgi:hypothetical protein
VRELVDVGVSPADVQLATADKAIEIHRRQRDDARLLDRIIGALPTDERSIQDEQADEGSQFVVFRSHGKDQEARTRRVLARHGARGGGATTGPGPGMPRSAPPAASLQVSDGPVWPRMRTRRGALLTACRGLDSVSAMYQSSARQLVPTGVMPSDPRLRPACSVIQNDTGKYPLTRAFLLWEQEVGGSSPPSPTRERYEWAIPHIEAPG